MPETFNFSGDAVTYLGFLGVSATGLILYWIFRSYFRSPLNKWNLFVFIQASPFVSHHMLKCGATSSTPTSDFTLKNHFVKLQMHCNWVNQVAVDTTTVRIIVTVVISVIVTLKFVVVRVWLSEMITSLIGIIVLGTFLTLFYLEDKDGAGLYDPDPSASDRHRRR